MPALFTRMSIEPNSPHLLHHLFRLGEVGGVAGVSLSLYALGGYLGLGGLAVLVDYEVCECDVCAFFGELERDGLANAARGPGYQGRLTCE